MSDSNVYTAERIISKEVRNGVTLYLIKWKGYSSRDNTWEPLENIIDHNLLDEYERKHQAKKNKRSSTISSTRSRSVAAVAKDSDDRENSIDNPPATTSKATPPTSPKFEQQQQSSVTASPSTLNNTSKSPVVDSKSSNSTSTSPSIKTSSSTVVGVSTKTPTPPPSSTASQIQKQVAVSPNNSKLSNFSTKSTEVQAGPLDSPQDKKLLNSKIAIMNTVITDVTVHDQTITICESKTHQGFFKEFLTPSQA